MATFRFYKAARMQEVSNEAVTPQTHYWLSRKDHIRNRRGKKKPRKLSSETGVLNNVLPGTWESTKTIFFLNMAKEIYFQMETHPRHLCIIKRGLIFSRQC